MEGSHRQKLLLILIQCHYKRNHRPILALILDYQKQPKLPFRTKRKTEVKTGHSSTRTLQPVTAEKWKTTSLAKFCAENWLITDIENNFVKSLHCSVS